MSKINIFDINRENSLIKESFINSFSDLYDAGDFTLGFRDGPVEELESIFKHYTNRKYALGVSSGTMALEMASYALDFKPGDEVIVPANTFLATATAPARFGATIVCADIDPHTLNISANTVKKVISNKTKAIFAVNMYGNPVNYDELDNFGIPIVEDAAHSHGAEVNGHISGSFGKYSCFSFFPTKVFGGIGDSGMLLFDCDSEYEKLKAFRNAGQSMQHYGIMPASVGRMHTVQALFLLKKWQIFKPLVEHRREISRVYDLAFNSSGIKIQQVNQYAKSSYFAYVIRVPNRDIVMGRLKELGIPTTIQYRYLINQQEFWGKINHIEYATPVAEEALETIFSIPMNYSVTVEQAGYIAQSIIEIIGAL